MRRYRVLLPLTVHTEDGSYVQGEEFEKDFSDEDEAENLDSGLLEVVASRYRVIMENAVVHDTPTGEEFEAALRQPSERFLLEGGYVELVQPEPEKPKRRAKPKADKE